MIVGSPKEIKQNEFRCGLNINSVVELKKHGHTVLIQNNIGEGVGVTNEDYKKAGAEIIETAEELFEKSELIVKVKEPSDGECKMLKPHHTLFTYIHLAALETQPALLQQSKATIVAYETVTDTHNRLPLLAPMSVVAGKLSTQVAAHYLASNNGGMGTLMGGTPGVAPANITILGGGVVGTGAMEIAMGMGANVTVLDNNINRLSEISSLYGTKVRTLFSSYNNIIHCCKNSDAIIGAVLIPGASAPKLINADMIKLMKPKTVLVDVAIDQGGCFETSKPTSHKDPIFHVDNVIHYCVTNMPGSVAKTSTDALNNATMPYIISLADNGYKVAFQKDPGLLNGLNLYKGHITNQPSAEALKLPCSDPSIAIEG